MQLGKGQLNLGLKGREVLKTFAVTFSRILFRLRKPPGAIKTSAILFQIVKSINILFNETAILLMSAILSIKQEINQTK